MIALLTLMIFTTHFPLFALILLIPRSEIVNIEELR